MKKLITEEDVNKAINSDKKIYIDSNTIITALAQDIARANSVEFLSSEEKPVNDENEKKEEVKVIEKTITDNEPVLSDPVLSANEIFQLLKACIEADLFTEEELLAK